MGDTKNSRSLWAPSDGQMVRMHRRLHEFKSVDFAKSLGISRIQLWRIEVADRLPSRRVARLIRKKLNLPKHVFSYAYCPRWDDLAVET